MGTIGYELDGGIAFVGMDDGKANALSPTSLAALREQLARAETEAKAVVLAGRPGRFSAGFDLKIMASGMDAATSLVADGARFMMDLLLFPKPVVAACTGHAVAGGALLLACCDRRVGVQGDFKIGLNEVSAQMPVPIFAHELARSRLDPRALTDSVLASRLYSGDEAAEVGWLDLAVPPDVLMSTARAEAERLAQLPSMPFAMTKKSLRGPLVQHVLGTLEANMAEFSFG